MGRMEYKGEATQGKKNEKKRGMKQKTLD